MLVPARLKIRSAEVRQIDLARAVMSVQVERKVPSIRRSCSLNAPCPCGSGHKFKKCCLAEANRRIYNQTIEVEEED